jgi:hypothetical protein
MLAELGHELWIGDAAQIRASVVRKQKTDARDAAHLLELLLSERGWLTQARFWLEWGSSGQSLPWRDLSHVLYAVNAHFRHYLVLACEVRYLTPLLR